MTGQEQNEEEAQAESERKTYTRHRIGVRWNSAGILAVILAAAILTVTLLLPVLQIFGSSMESALCEGDFVIVMRYVRPKRGDIVAFYNDNKILVKRVIALPGEQVDIDEEGKVYINGSLLEEPYVNELAYGGCDICFPVQVPEGTVFVMGDNRSVSVDSRSSSVGCVQEGQLVGKIICRIWPLTEMGMVD